MPFSREETPQGLTGGAGGVDVDGLGVGGDAGAVVAGQGLVGGRLDGWQQSLDTRRGRFGAQVEDLDAVTLQVGQHLLQGVPELCGDKGAWSRVRRSPNLGVL